MNKSACSAVTSQPSGCKQNHDIGTQCGATRPSKYTKILAGKVVNRKVETTTETVRKMCPPPMSTTIQVIGTVTLNTINYQDFVPDLQIC